MYHSDYVAAVLVAIICGTLAIFVTILAIYLLFQYAPTERQKRAQGFNDWLWMQWRREQVEKMRLKEEELAHAREEKASRSASPSMVQERRPSG